MFLKTKPFIQLPGLLLFPGRVAASKPTSEDFWGSYSLHNNCALIYTKFQWSLQFYITLFGDFYGP